MNKADIVKKVASETDLSQQQVTDALEGILSAIGGSLKKRDDVRLIGFGTFYASKRKAYDARNPQNGEKIKIEACHIPKFRAGKALKNLVA